MLQRCHAEMIKFVGYRAPMAYALVALAISAVWALAFAYYFGSEGEPASRVGTSVVGGTTDYAFLAFGLAVAVLLAADHNGGTFNGALLPRAGLSKLIASKAITGAVIGVVVAVLCWSAVSLITSTVAPAVGGPGPEQTMPYLVPMLFRLIIGFLISGWIGMCWAVLFNYSHRMVIFAILAWAIVVEVIISALAPGDLGGYVAPFRIFSWFVTGDSLNMPYPYGWEWSWAPLVVFALLLTAVVAIREQVRNREQQLPARTSAQDVGSTQPAGSTARNAVSTPPVASNAAPTGRLARAVASEVLRSSGWRSVVRWLIPVLLVSLIGTVSMAGLVLTSRGNGGEIAPGADLVLVGFTMVGIVLVLVNAAWSYLGESSSGVLLDVYRFTPQRVLVLVAKTLWVAVLAWLTSLLTVVGAFLIYALLDPGPGGALMMETLTGRMDIVLGVPTVAAIGSVVALSLAIIIRNVPITLAIIILWMLIAEDMVPFIPEVGSTLAQFLPMENAWYAAGAVDEPLLTANRLVVWLYLLAWAVIAWVIALLIEQRRDLRR